MVRNDKQTRVTYLRVSEALREAIEIEVTAERQAQRMSATPVSMSEVMRQLLAEAIDVRVAKRFEARAAQKTRLREARLSRSRAARA